MLDLESAAAVMWRRRAGVILIFIALAVAITWPQARFIGTHAPEHQDVYFNLWRLAWVSHALATSPSDLFNGNQFYPEPRSLAFSDAMLVEGLIAAPMLWAGIPRVLVHNLLLLGALVASGTGAYALARHLTGSSAAGVTAGIVFAFAPYRFDHYMHMELQWAMWMPWAFWALQRTLETGTLRYGALTGLFIALQMASSVYYGLFLSIAVAVAGGLQILSLARTALLTRVRALALGAALAVSVSGVYSIPYASASARVGERHPAEVTTFSARPRDYRVATETNLLYGTERGRPERRLFPGLVPPLLALIGLLLVLPSAAIVAYTVGLAVMLELSLGMYGMLYPFLYDHVSAFRGLRAPARAAIVCLMFLGVLAAHGQAAVARHLGARARRLLALGVPAVVMLEYWVAPLELIPYPNDPPPLYALLARQEPGVVAEFPMPEHDRLPGFEPRYVYMSTFHWMPLLNGYSGYYPPVYIHRLIPLARFPDAHAIRWLEGSDVRYIVVHSGGYRRKEFERIVQTLAIDRKLPFLGRFDDGWEVGALFRIP